MMSFGAVARARIVYQLNPLSPIFVGHRTYATKPQQKGTPVKGTHAKAASVQGSSAKDKERIAKEKQRERDLKEKERAKAAANKEKDRATLDKQKEKDRQQKDKEKDALAKQKEKEREKLQKDKEKEKLSKEKEKEKLSKEKEKEREKKLKTAEKEREQKAKLKEEKEQEKKAKEEKPKKALSSYMFFTMEARPDIAKKNPSFKITEIARELAKQWKALTPAQKEKYEAKHTEDKAKYDKAKQAYDETHPKPPKRALTSFMMFVKENRGTVVQQNPKASITDVIKLVAQNWKALTPEQKKPYEKLADDSKSKYEKERKAFEENIAK